MQSCNCSVHRTRLVLEPLRIDLLLTLSLQSTRKYLQEEDCYNQAGKVKVLLRLLEGYRREDRRVLIFSQVGIGHPSSCANYRSRIFLVYPSFRHSAESPG